MKSEKANNILDFTIGMILTGSFAKGIYDLASEGDLRIAAIGILLPMFIKIMMIGEDIKCLAK